MIKSVVIVGAGQAGLQTAISLRQAGFEGRIILLGAESRLPYQRPPLSKQVLKGEFTEDKCTLRQQDFLDTQNIEFRPGSQVISLDAQGRTVTLEGGRMVDFDAAVIATGSRLNRITLGGSLLSGVNYLRTLDDALQLREQLKPGVRLVVAGAGYIGLEVAASARAMGCDVSVVETESGIMQRSALGPIASFLEDRHRSEGVTFYFENLLTEIHGGRKVQAVSLDDGTLLDANVVLKGLGVQPQVAWLEGSGIEVDRGVLVNEGCQTNMPNVFAAGDCAQTRHLLYPEPVVLESVQNAVSQGKLCAAAILGQDVSYEEPPWFWSEQYDCRLQMAGLPQSGDKLVLRENGPNSLTVLSLGADRLNALQCINAPRDYMAGRKLIAAGDRVNRERLADPKTELKDLL